MNLFLTGVPGVGKSTLLNNLLNRLAPQMKGSVGGYYTTRTVTSAGRTFYLNDHRTGEQIYMASWLDGKMDVNAAAFDDFGVRSIGSALELNDIIVLDELGRFEEKREPFKTAVHAALDSGKLVLGVLKVCDSAFIDGIKAREDVTVRTITEANRDAALNELLALLRQSLTTQ